MARRVRYVDGIVKGAKVARHGGIDPRIRVGSSRRGIGLAFAAGVDARPLLAVQ